MELAIGVLTIILLSALAFWRPTAALVGPLFMVLAGLSMMIGLRWFDIYTNVTGMAFSIGFIGYAFLCLGYTFRVIFWVGGE